MRTSRSQLFTIIFLVFTTFTTAWPWPRWLPELDALVVRQESSDQPSATPTKASATNTNKDSTITPAPSNSDSNSDKNSKTDGGSQTGSGTSKASFGKTTLTGDETKKESATKTASETEKTSYDARLPAGGVAMITPAVIDGEQYYKIGDFVTFAWNYTSLEATPTAVNILASCKANAQTYTIAANQTITNATQSVVWDTGSYQQSALSKPLLTEKYTLIIYDADSEVTAQAQAGYLAVFNQYTFGMYERQKYVPWNEFICATCSGALGDMEMRAIGMALGMGALTVLSFTWFVGGTGIIW